MSEVGLPLVNSSNSCTMYTIQFLSDEESEFEKFVSKFIDDAELNPDLKFSFLATVTSKTHVLTGKTINFKAM